MQPATIYYNNQNQVVANGRDPSVVGYYNVNQPVAGTPTFSQDYAQYQGVLKNLGLTDLNTFGITAPTTNDALYSGTPAYVPPNANAIPSSVGTPPATSPITNPVTPPNTSASGVTPNLPSATAPSIANNYNQSIASQLDQQKAAVQAEAEKRAQDYQTQMDDLKKQMADLQTLQDTGLAGQNTAMLDSVKAKQDALTLEKQRFDENYNANQALVGELGDLLTQGNTLVEQMKGTTGLASIMDPRIAKTMTDVQARAGVIQAVLSARNGQMSYAQQQLGTTVSAISSIYNDQINYYKSVVDFYQTQKDETGKLLYTMTASQKDYLDVKLNMLNNDLANTQATANIIQKAMLDPDTASAYGNAGVSLTDSPQQIAQKLAQYNYSQELKTTSNAMVTNGYSSTPQNGVQPTIITDSAGNTKAWYKVPSTTASSTSIINSGGRQLLINDLTGATIQDLGPSANNGSVELSAGASLVDPKTGKVIVTAPTAANSTAAAKSPLGASSANFPTVQLQPGSTGAEVTKLQNALGIPATGTYDAATMSAVLDLQKKLGIDYSTGPGYYGPKTLAAIHPPASTTTPSGKTTKAQASAHIDNIIATGGANGGKATGSDGYLSPTDWYDAQKYWITVAGLPASDFNTLYGRYLNPADKGGSNFTP